MAWTWRNGEEAERSDHIRMISRYNGIRSPIAGFCWQTCQHQHLSRVFETACSPLGPEDVSWQKICPLGPEDVSWQKISLSANPAPTHITRTAQRVLAGTLADRPSYSPNLNPLDFAIWHICRAKVLSMPCANLDALCPSVSRGIEPVSSRIHTEDLPLIPPL